MAQICMFNVLYEKKLNARFFIQNITKVDTYFSIKHWYSMQRALANYGGQPNQIMTTQLDTSPTTYATNFVKF